MGKTANWQILVIIVLIALTLLPFIQNKEVLSLDEDTRQLLGGTFVELSDGYTHYELLGPQDAPTIVLIHGFSAPMYIWDGMADDFVVQGFRVLRFDLYGRGYSDRPETDYTLELYMRQLDELLTSLDLNTGVHLVGLSYSGPITAGFTSRFPEKVLSLTLIDPMAAAVSGKEIEPMNWSLVGEYIMVVYLAPVYLPESQAQDLKYPHVYPNWEELYRKQQQYAGWRRAILSSTREMVKFEPLEEYHQVGESDVPIMLMWGSDDHLIPEERILNVKSALGDVPFKTIEDAGHLPFLDQPEEVSALILEFLSE
ncbi:MAG: alpha/beta hydrolase [Anaerolineaceae bacterium]|nr:alpha/beta hydrolase [Anaerolineaceae bacterium]